MSIACIYYAHSRDSALLQLALHPYVIAQLCIMFTFKVYNYCVLHSFCRPPLHTRYVELGGGGGDCCVKEAVVCVCVCVCVRVRVHVRVRVCIPTVYCYQQH